MSSALPEIVEVLIQAGAKVDAYRTLVVPHEYQKDMYLPFGTPLDIDMDERSNVIARIEGRVQF